MPLNKCCGGGSSFSASPHLSRPPPPSIILSRSQNPSVLLCFKPSIPVFPSQSYPGFSMPVDSLSLCVSPSRTHTHTKPASLLKVRALLYSFFTSGQHLTLGRSRERVGYRGDGIIQRKGPCLHLSLGSFRLFLFLYCQECGGGGGGVGRDEEELSNPH